MLKFLYAYITSNTPLVFKASVSGDHVGISLNSSSMITFKLQYTNIVVQHVANMLM